MPPFQIFLDDHRDDVYRFLVASVGPVEADDCFQETFLAALRAYPTLARQLEPARLGDHDRQPQGARRDARAQAPADPAGRTAGAGERRANGFDAELWSAVGELPDKQRTAVLHRYVNDLAYAEIGRAMDCTPEAARRSVHEGVKKLREAKER